MTTSRVMSEPPGSQQRTPSPADEVLSRRPVVIAVICGVVSLIAGALLVLLPVMGRQATWEWKPTESTPASATAVVAAGAPQLLTIDIPCAPLKLRTLVDRAPQTVVAVNGRRPMMLGVADGRLWVSVDGTRLPTIDVPLGPEGCTARLLYDGATQVLTLSAGAEPSSTSLREPDPAVAGAFKPSFTVEAFSVDPPFRGFTTVTMQLRPSTIAWPFWRWSLVAVAALAAVVAAGALRKVGRGGEQPERVADPSPRWTLSDTAIVVGALVALFFVPPLSDDGWVLTTARNFHDLGFFSNYYTASAAPQAQGFWWSFLQQAWLRPLEMPLIFMRVPSLLIVLLSWWLLRRKILDRIVRVSDRTLVRGIGAVLALAFLVAWTPTVRPEPVVGLLLVVQFIVLAGYVRQRSAGLLVVAGALAAMAFSAHQSGWVVVTAALAILPLMVRWVKDSSQRALALLAVLAAAATTIGLTVALMMIHSNLAVFNFSRESFAGEGVHDLTFDELLRVKNFASGQAPLRVVCLGLVLIAALAFLLRRKRRRGTLGTWIGYAALCSLAGLILTSSKWIWHLAAVWPSVAVLGGLGALGLGLVGSAARRRALAATLAVVAVVWLFSRYPEAWGRLDSWTVSVRDSDPAGSLAFWIAVGLPAIVLVLGCWYLVARVSRGAAAVPFAQRLVLVATAVAVLLVGGVSLLPMVRDAAAQPARSWAGVVATSARTDACGLAGPGGLEIPTRTRGLPVDPIEPGTTDVGELLQFSEDRVGSIRPVDSPSWRAAKGSSSVVTPWYRVDPDHPMRTWMLPASTGYSLRVRWEGGTPGSSTVQEVRRAGTEPYWHLLELPAPPQVQRFRFEWRRGDGPLEVLNPVAVLATSPLNALVGEAAVWQPPYTAMWATCLRPPGIATGLLERYGWALAAGPEIAQWRLSENSVLSEQACVENAAQVRMCALKSVPPQQGGVRTSFRSVPW